MSEIKNKSDTSVENVEEDVQLTGLEAFEAMVEDHDAFTDDFKVKSTTIFESAINRAKIQIQEQLQEETDKTLADNEKALNESINNYLTAAVNEWIETNSVAIDTSLKTSITEDFMSGLQSLFKEHYIDVPEGKTDLLEETAQKADDFAEQLEESKLEVEKLIATVESFQRKEIISEATVDLTDSQKEKFDELVESVDFNTAEKFSKKVGVLLESFTAKSNYVATEDVEVVRGNVILEDASAGEYIEEDVDPEVAAIVQALNKQ